MADGVSAAINFNRLRTASPDSVDNRLPPAAEAYRHGDNGSQGSVVSYFEKSPA